MHSPIVYMSLPTAIVVDDSTVDTEFGPVFKVRVVFSMMEGCALLEAYWSLRRRAAAGDSCCEGSFLAGSSLGGEGRGGGAAVGGDGDSIAACGGAVVVGVGVSLPSTPPPLAPPPPPAETRRLRRALPASIVFLRGLSAMMSTAADTV